MHTQIPSTISEEWVISSTISELQEAMHKGVLTSRQLVLTFLSRIGRYNTEGPAIRAVLEVNPDALQIADALDRERQVSGTRGPLHGIPMLVKDNLDTGDKMHTSAGSLALADSYAKEDSFVVQQLRKAGVVILGKTNMTEWANFMTDHMPSGYSSRGGQVLNPYGPGQFDCGGSSSGSGSAVAAAFAAAAIGTETSGSILSPASSNSIVGLKPTVGLVSRTGIIPIAHSQDTAGPMARTVADVAVVLSALTGVDGRDAATATSVGRTVPDYTVFLKPDALRGKRIGVPRDPYFTGLDDHQKALLNNAIAKMAELGAEVVEDVVIPSTSALNNYDVLIYEFKSDLNAYLAGVSPHLPVHNLKELIAYNNEDPERMLKYGQTILLESEATSGTLTERAYLKAREQDLRLSQEEGIDHVLKEQQLDALVFPANWGAGIAAKAGYPSITVPAGYSPEGEPIGVTFTSTAYTEGLLLSLAYAYEQATHHRVSPVLEI